MPNNDKGSKMNKINKTITAVLICTALFTNASAYDVLYGGGTPADAAIAAAALITADAALIPADAESADADSAWALSSVGDVIYSGGTVVFDNIGDIVLYYAGTPAVAAAIAAAGASTGTTSESANVASDVASAIGAEAEPKKAEKKQGNALGILVGAEAEPKKAEKKQQNKALGILVGVGLLWYVLSPTKEKQYANGLNKGSDLPISFKAIRNYEGEVGVELGYVNKFNIW